MAGRSQPAETRGERRRRAILDAALALFAEQGYTRTSVRAVGARAGASTETIYRHFGDKDGLLQAVADMLARDIAGAQDGGDLFAPDRAPETVLHETGERFLAVLLQPRALGFFRLAVGEAPRSDAVARAFWYGGPGRTRERLAAYLAAQVERGRLRLDDPTLAAGQFFGMLHGTLHMRALLGLETPDAATVTDSVAHATATFLDGCRAG